MTAANQAPLIRRKQQGDGRLQMDLDDWENWRKCSSHVFALWRRMYYRIEVKWEPDFTWASARGRSAIVMRSLCSRNEALYPEGGIFCDVLVTADVRRPTQRVTHSFPCQLSEVLKWFRVPETNCAQCAELCSQIRSERGQPYHK